MHRFTACPPLVFETKSIVTKSLILREAKQRRVASSLGKLQQLAADEKTPSGEARHRCRPVP
jgi:hypothetical protein